MPKSLLIKRWACKIGYVIFFLVLPLLMINDKYELFSKETNTTAKVTVWFFIVLFICYFFLRNIIKDFVKNLAPGALRKVLLILFKSLPIIVVYIVLRLVKAQMQDVEQTIENLFNEFNKFVVSVEWIASSIIIANVFDSFYYDFTQEYREVKLTLRQDNYRKKYKL